MSNIKKHSKEGAKANPDVELIRCCTVPICNCANQCIVIRHPIVAADFGDEMARCIYSKANKENDGNYDEPILNSILALGRQMHEMQLDKAPKRTCCPTDLSPRSKAVVIPKISQKLNFPQDKTIFRNLIPINVNDCNLLPKKKLSLHKKYIKSKHRAPTPDLGDFLDPLPPLVHVIPEPDIDLIYGPREIDSFEEFCEFYRDVNPRWIRDECEM